MASSSAGNRSARFQRQKSATLAGFAVLVLLLPFAGAVAVFATKLAVNPDLNFADFQTFLIVIFGFAFVVAAILFAAGGYISEDFARFVIGRFDRTPDASTVANTTV